LTDMAREDAKWDLFCCGTGVRSWHLASFRCGAKVQTLLEVERTCRDRRRRINLTKMTPKPTLPDRMDEEHG
jgi:hypothetical protein